MKPPFAYFGGKTILAPKIAALLPPHQHYVEPFCGGASVLLAKAPSTMETINDLDGRLMTFWRVLRDQPEDLMRVCALTPHSRGEYQRCLLVDEDPLEDEVEVARRVWVRISQGRGGTQRRTGWRNYVKPRGSSIGMPGYLEAYVDRMATVAARLQHVSLECRPALELIEQYGSVERGVVMYVDPPYLRSTRSGRNYLVEMCLPDEHAHLAKLLNDAKATVLLSGYDSPLYDELYEGWYRETFQATTNGGAAGNRGVRTEVLWSNRPLTATAVT
ncbi:DNA adenine methylase [Jatrophihabitans sp.]|uniref:DNA adenine methylase n=1 Tax=Jatrophihabitans sp. TaxID=1932789 RepID=UPI0030C72755|nr:class adenine-specific methyltransferase [Jatrophihabitans sp.]